MNLTVTIALIAGFAGFGLFAGWRGARPPNPHKGPRLMPWRFLMTVSAFAAIVLIAHLLNLLGVKTGRGD